MLTQIKMWGNTLTNVLNEIIIILHETLELLLLKKILAVL